jgi:hypothetical protein
VQLAARDGAPPQVASSPDDLGEPRFARRPAPPSRSTIPTASCGPTPPCNNTRPPPASRRRRRRALRREFVLKLLKKRLFSSPEAFQLTLEKSTCAAPPRRSQRHAAERPATAARARDQRRRGGERRRRRPRGRRTSRSSTPPVAPPRPRRAGLLAELLRPGPSAPPPAPTPRPRPYSTSSTRTVRPGGHWADTRVMIFTEYRATQNWLLELPRRQGFTEARSHRLALRRHGPRERERVKAAFQADPDDPPRCASCSPPTPPPRASTSRTTARLIHYEIPGTPTGWSSATAASTATASAPSEVQIFHFVGRGFERDRAREAPPRRPRRRPRVPDADRPARRQDPRGPRQRRRPARRPGRGGHARQAPQHLHHRAGPRGPPAPADDVLKLERELRKPARAPARGPRPDSRRHLHLSPERVLRPSSTSASSSPSSQPLRPFTRARRHPRLSWSRPLDRHMGAPAARASSTLTPARCARSSSIADRARRPRRRRARPPRPPPRADVRCACSAPRSGPPTTSTASSAAAPPASSPLSPSITPSSSPTPASSCSPPTAPILHEELIDRRRQTPRGPLSAASPPRPRARAAPRPSPRPTPRRSRSPSRASSTAGPVAEAPRRPARGPRGEHGAARQGPRAADFRSAPTTRPRDLEDVLERPAHQRSAAPSTRTLPQFRSCSPPRSGHKQLEHNRDAMYAPRRGPPGTRSSARPQAVRERFRNPRPRLFPVALTYLVPEREARRSR